MVSMLNECCILYILNKKGHCISRKNSVLPVVSLSVTGSAMEHKLKELNGGTQQVLNKSKYVEF